MVNECTAETAITLCAAVWLRLAEVCLLPGRGDRGPGALTPSRRTTAPFPGHPSARSTFLTSAATLNPTQFLLDLILDWSGPGATHPRTHPPSVLTPPLHTHADTHTLERACGPTQPHPGQQLSEPRAPFQSAMTTIHLQPYCFHCGGFAASQDALLSLQEKRGRIAHLASVVQHRRLMRKMNSAVVPSAIITNGPALISSTRLFIYSCPGR